MNSRYTRDAQKKQAFYDSWLERTYPYIPWRTPITIAGPKASTDFGCRLCIAYKGLTAFEIKDLPRTQKAFALHMKRVHSGGQKS